MTAGAALTARQGVSKGLDPERPLTYGPLGSRRGQRFAPLSGRSVGVLRDPGASTACSSHDLPRIAWQFEIEVRSTPGRERLIPELIGE